MDRDGSGDQEDVVEWLGLTAGLHEDVVTEATPRLRSEHVYVVSDLALLEEEGGLGDVFTTRVSARKVRDALRLRSAAQPATVDCPAGGRSREAAEQEAAVEAAVEVATGGVGASAPTAAEWDDRGEHDYTSLGCSPAHLAVPLIPRHAGGGDGGASGCALVPSTPRGAPPGGAEAAPWWKAAVEQWIAATGDVGARAAAAAEWGDQVSMPRGDLVIPRHAGGGDGGGWATEECDGRRLPASPEQLEEEERDNAYDKAGFLSFMEDAGFDLRQVGH